MEHKDVNNIEALVSFINGKSVSGYIWHVEDKQPKIFNNEALVSDDFEPKNNIYNTIQESYLYDGTHSVHIINSDGVAMVFVNKINDFDKVDNVVKYPSHLKTDKYKIEKILFKQAFKLTPNPISGDNFETYQPVVKLFVGTELDEL